MNTSNLCFEQKYERYQFLSEKFQFLKLKFSIYLNMMCFRYDMSSGIRTV